MTAPCLPPTALRPTRPNPKSSPTFSNYMPKRRRSTNEIYPLVFSAGIWYTNNRPPAEALPKRRKAGVKPGLSISCVMKVIVYIDGFNLFYGMLKGTPYKWLDLEKFADGMVAPGVVVVAIKYFTAPIKAYPPNPDKLLRQHFYLEALSSLSRVRIVEGFYTKHKVRMPFYKEPCLSCPSANGMASVVKLEEKRRRSRRSRGTSLNILNPPARSGSIRRSLPLQKRARTSGTSTRRQRNQSMP